MGKYNIDGTFVKNDTWKMPEPADWPWEKMPSIPPIPPMKPIAPIDGTGYGKWQPFLDKELDKFKKEMEELNKKPKPKPIKKKPKKKKKAAKPRKKKEKNTIPPPPVHDDNLYEREI